MQDRVPLYPGRVKMTPVAGQANTFDMVRADDPTQAGTPLNKATLLKDATAALYGLGTGAVPDDVLEEIGKYKQYWWRRRLPAGDWEYLQSSDRSAYPDSGTQAGYKYEYLGIPFDNAVTAPRIETGSYVGTGTYGQSNPSQITFEFAPSWVIMLYVDGRYPNRLHLTDYGAASFLPMDAITTTYKNTQAPSVQGYSANDTYAKKSEDGKILYWYNTNSAISQLNETIDKLFYIAFS